MLTKLAHFIHSLLGSTLKDKFSKEGFVIYTRNVQWFGISKVFTLLFSLVTTMVVARILGPEIFGKLNYALSVIGIFAVFANLGIDNILYRELVAYKEKREELLGSAICLKLLLGTISILGLSIFLFFLKEEVYIKIIIGLLSLTFITQPFTLFSFDFLKDKEAKYVTITQVLTLLISNGLKILSVLVTPSLIYFSAILILENIIAGVIYVYQLKRIKKVSLQLRPTKKMVRAIFFLSLPLVLFSVFGEIYARIDQIMLRHFIDTTTVGFYAAAVRITELCYTLPNILLGALFPALVNALNVSKTEYAKRFKFFYYTLGVASVCISLLFFVFSNLLIKIIYGAKFLEAAPILSIYIFSLFGSFICGLIYQDLIIKNSTRLLITLPALTAIINITLNLYLIPTYGAEGAALATVISYNLTPFFWYILKNLPIYKTKEVSYI